MKLAPCPDCASGFSLNLGAGLSPGQTNASWKLRLDLLPAAFTERLYRPGTEATWQGNILTGRAEDLVVRVEEGTGRLLELGSTSPQTASGAEGSDPYRLRVRFALGTFGKAVDEMAASTSKYPDAFESQRTLGSALGFVAAELAMAEPLWRAASGSSADPPHAALASALEKLLASSFLDPLQTLLDEAQASRRDQAFTIPSKLMFLDALLPPMAAGRGKRLAENSG